MATELWKEQIDSWYRQWIKVDRLYEGFAQRSGLTMTSFSVLRYLLENGANTQRALCQGLGYPKQTLSCTVKILERQGHVRQEVCPEDRRSARIVLTGQGRAWAAGVLKRLQQAEQEAFEALGPDGRRYFTQYNELLAHALGDAMARWGEQDESAD